jgi:hypothetical protein
MQKSILVPASRIYIYKAIFVMLLSGIILQDLPSQNLFGTIARSPIFLLAPLSFLILLLVDKKIQLFKLARYYIYYWVITTIVALILLLFFIIKNQTIAVYDQNLLIKLFKSSFYNLTFFFTAYSLSVIIDGIDLLFIYKVLKKVFIFLILYAVIERSMPQVFSFLHTLYNEDSLSVGRLKLTTSESSVASSFFITIALCFIILRVYYRKNYFWTIIYSIFSFLVFAGIASKGAIVIVIALIWAIRKYLSIRVVIFSLTIIIPIIILAIRYVIPEFQNDIENFSSVSTRVTTGLAAFYSLVLYPIGEGYATYLAYFPKLLLPVFNWLYDVTGIPFISTEIDLMVETGSTLGPKSGFTSEIMYNGWIAILFIILICKYISNTVNVISHKQVRILASMLFCYLFMSFLTSVAIETAYFLLLPILICVKIGKLTSFSVNN